MENLIDQNRACNGHLGNIDFRWVLRTGRSARLLALKRGGRAGLATATGGSIDFRWALRTGAEGRAMPAAADGGARLPAAIAAAAAAGSCCSRRRARPPACRPSLSTAPAPQLRRRDGAGPAHGQLRRGLQVREEGAGARGEQLLAAACAAWVGWPSGGREGCPPGRLRASPLAAAGRRLTPFPAWRSTRSNWLLMYLGDAEVERLARNMLGWVSRLLC